MKLLESIAHRWISNPLGLGMMILTLLASIPISAQGSLQVICAPDTPIAHIGESITLRAWAVEGDVKPVMKSLDWAWSSSAGTISGKDIATWSFGPLDGPDGEYIKSTATVTAHSKQLGRASCELTITLTWPDDTETDGTRGIGSEGKRPTGRSFLLPEEKEPKGYGLYSYLLFGSPPRDETERARYLGAIKSYLHLIQPIEKMKRYCNCRKLNLILLPIEKKIVVPGNPSDPKQVAVSSKQILDVYDYARAQYILTTLDQTEIHSGPYLISTLMPAGSDENDVMLHLNMSRVLPSLVPEWLKTFSNLATQEHSWSVVTLSELALLTRNALAVMSRDTPEVIAALVGWINVIRRK